MTLVPELIAAGVCSLKIEGRLKTPEYVANITRHYRQAIDAAHGGRRPTFRARRRRDGAVVLRGFSPGWLGGCDHKKLVPGLSSAKHGVLVGEVCHVGRGRVGSNWRVDRCGDGVVFEGNRGTDEEQGGRVYEIFPPTIAPARRRRARVELAFAHGAIDFAGCTWGNKSGKPTSPQLTGGCANRCTLAERTPAAVSRRRSTPPSASR